MKDKVINNFRGKYYFLSNFAPIYIYDGFANITYPTLEHAFQACKTFNISERKNICNETTPGKAKKAGGPGGYITLRQDWEQVKVQTMLDLLRIKFEVNPEYAKRLIDTYPCTLIEGGFWVDDFWGVTSAGGKNMLGKLLMKVRDELRNKVTLNSN